jgi:predicted CoA-binding protein
MNVAVLGASPKPERYSHQAVVRLRAKGHAVFPVNPGVAEMLGLKVYARLADISVALDTVTVYLSPDKSTALADEIVAARPRRVMLNPGAENPALAEVLRQQGIEVVDACTLVLLRTEQF